MRVPSTEPQAPGSIHAPLTPLLSPPELEFAKSIMKIAEAGKVSIHQQVTRTRLSPRAQALKNPSPVPSP